MSAIKAVMIVRQSAVKELMEELADVIADQPGLVIKIEKDGVFDSIFDINTTSIDVDMSDETFMFIAKKAHEKNITFNQMVTEILIRQIEREELKKDIKFSGITPKAETYFTTKNDLSGLVDELLMKT
jgi:hypothetical protein